MTHKPPQWLEAILPQTPQTPEGLLSGVVHASCEKLLAQIPDNSVDLILTDPPYFIDRMGSNWHKEGLKKSAKKAQVIGSMPVGMKFDPKQGKDLQKNLTPIFQECFRILKPGGFIVSFSQARLYHRMAMACEDVGFEIRDMLGWTYEGQAKAFSQDHFVKRMDLSDKDKENLIKSMGGRKTPQFKPMIEPMVFGQKPKTGTFVENWQAFGVGLIDTTELWEGKFPGQLMNARKPSQSERGEGNNHFTVKPQSVLQHLIKVLTKEGGVVVDPFAGSSSTQLAAMLTNRHAVGSEREQEDFETSVRRLNDARGTTSPVSTVTKKTQVKKTPAKKSVTQKLDKQKKGKANAK